MKIKKIVASLFAVGVMAAPLAHATDGYFSHGYGMKAKGMGGAGIALPQDSLAAATNPAGMVMVGDRIDLGIDWFKPTRGSDIVGNGAGLNGTYSGNGTNNFFIPEFGYNKMMNPDMSLGVSVYGNGGMNTDYTSSPFAAFGGTSPAGVNLEQLFIAPTWAMKLNSNNSIGVSLNLAYQSFEAKGLQPFAIMSSAPTLLTNNGKDSSTGYGLRLGWTGQVTPTVTLGATYQTKTKMGKLSKYAGLFAEQGGFDIPANYGVGIAAKLSDTTTVAADIEQIQYSGVPSVANSGANPGLLGANNGAGFGWRDMTVFKLGVSHQYDSGLVIRAGYNGGRQPIPETETFFNILAPGVVQDHLTLGATWTMPSKSELTLGYMHAFKKTINGVNSIPAGMGGGNANLNMYEDSLGIAYGWKM
ncbi:MAG: outer membrane protein transport protein [Betaproteobacteria bacterium]|nr:outer membrane protein transport protein [Betaproteobacteria bacterium]